MLRTVAHPGAFVLDNTFPHYVYNEAEAERFVLMIEMYHPALTPHEVSTLAEYQPQPPTTRPQPQPC